MAKKKNVSADGQEQQLHGFKSLASLVVLGVVIAMLCIAIVAEIVNVVEFRTNYKDTIRNDLLTMVKIGGDLMDAKEVQINANPTILEGLIGEIKLEHCSTSYAYAVNHEGIMLYHPTPEKIGEPVENAAVKSLLEQLKTGAVPEPGVIEYEFKGAMKYAAYYVQPMSKNILIITVDENDVYAPINSTTIKAVIIIIIAFVILAVIMAFAAKTLLRPIGVLTEILEDSARLDLRHNDKSQKVVYRRDEIGIIGRDIGSLRKVLRTVVGEIGGSEEHLSDIINQLKDTTVKLNDNSADNSATSQELAAGMQEAADSTDAINANVTTMVENANQINELSEQGAQHAVEIKNKAEGIRRDVQSSISTAKSIFEDVKRQSDEAIEQSKAVDKINELTEQIRSIASQTNLLALNASIEAARAGEAGKGFAVVAEEIGQLAAQSADTAKEINDIILDLTRQSEQSIETIDLMNTKLDEQSKQLDTTKEDMISMQEGVSSVSVNANEISGRVTNLDSSKTNLVEIIDSLSAISEENAASTQETNASMQELNATFEIINKASEDLKALASQLNDKISYFTIE